MIHGRPSRPLWIALVAAPVLFAAIALLQERIDAQTRSAAKQHEELLLSSGPVLKKLSLGYDSLLADIYWTRVVQYYGSKVANLDPDFELLPGLLDITTTLDPHLLIAYRFGAIFLSEPSPTGAARTDIAIALVKRGIAENPDYWMLDADLGFLYYWHQKDYAAASAAYLEGSKKANAAEWMKLMAARVSEKGGELETSRMIWAQLYQTTKDPQVRKKAIEHLEGLTALRDIGWLNDYAKDYHERFGRYPKSEKELFDAGLIRGIPLDSAGIPYVFGPDGKAQLDPKSPVVLETIPEGPRE